MLYFFLFGEESSWTASERIELVEVDPAPRPLTKPQTAPLGAPFGTSDASNLFNAPKDVLDPNLPPDGVPMPEQKTHGKANAAEKAEPKISGNKNSKPGDKAMTIEGSMTPEDGSPRVEYLAICLAVRDQALDLPEFFVHHYHHLDVRRFYIMDDGSEPLLSTITEYGVPSSVLTFEYQDQARRAEGHAQQLHIYARCIWHYGKQHTWMAFLDADEFLQTTGNETLRQILSELDEDDNIGALAVNWQIHTSSGLLKRPQSARKAFTECIWDDDEHDGASSHNTHVKSIVKTAKAQWPRNPHTWMLKDGAITVGEDGDAVETEATRAPITRDRIALHHYAGKSREEYEEKMLRGNAMDDPKGEAFWNSLEHELPHVNCTAMAKYNP